MAYTDDAVQAKLSALNETQEGIVTVAQWIMFHRRHADRTAQLWMQRLKESAPNKRLSLIYLANEVVQQSKARKKAEFVNAFSPIIAECTAVAYKGAPYDIQQKLRRVIEVWRQRVIFDPPVQDQVERNLDDLDKTRAPGKKATLGGSLFSSGSAVPQELQPLVPLQNTLSKAETTSKNTVTHAYDEYDKLIDPANPVPTPPVQAARLSQVLKNLASAEGAVAESIKARRELIAGLEKMLEGHKTTLARDEAAHQELGTRRAGIENKKREVEDAIMRGLSTEPTPISAANDPRRRIPTSADNLEEPQRPDVEGLTPPPIESITPVGTPPHSYAPTSTTGADTFPPEQPPSHNEPPPSAAALEALAANNILPQKTARDDTNGHSDGYPGSKKRRVGAGVAEQDFAEFADGDAYDGIDADVADMLGRD
ncbi:RNA polymerase II large subunit CTD [Macrophomina phaseolina MS6]|uniref:RNA polymerase II large subunit CTD n=1 Tax=Macrophomina phaseolina (strain MS6) TaxID=1126212 RepID=K2RKI6_MACPH|nr:RNA polymerase II large subunit CTD [Macrophomina phaseolina MS6]